MPTLDERCQTYRERLDRYAQGHLLAFWPCLDATQRTQLLEDLDQIDLECCRRLIGAYVLCKPRISLPAKIDPPPILPADPDADHAELYHRARAAGREAIRAGRVAAFTVAGGQGTRLGFDGPKGAFPIGPIRDASLFQLLAESLLGVQRRYGCRPRWYIMTSPTNHVATLDFFAASRYFGLRADDVVFFAQGQVPAFLPDGRIALARPHRVALSPDGHGGSLRALASNGALDDMREHGIDLISYFQVDNPLVKMIDPLFIGLHMLTGSEMSTKAVTKADDLERVGNICLADGRLAVIEYSDLPPELARARNRDGSRRLDAGNIAIHVLSRVFVERLTAGPAAGRLPWHRAEKQVSVVDPDGRLITPTGPNVVKLETFVFDAIPLARNPLVMYTPRAEEFSPIKNAEGVDSPAVARRDLIRRAARWLEGAGVSVSRDATGELDPPIEISPAFALDAQDLRERLPVPPPEHVPGHPLLLG